MSLPPMYQPSESSPVTFLMQMLSLLGYNSHVLPCRAPTALDILHHLATHSWLTMILVFKISMENCTSLIMYVAQGVNHKEQLLIFSFILTMKIILLWEKLPCPLLDRAAFFMIHQVAKVFYNFTFSLDLITIIKCTTMQWKKSLCNILNNHRICKCSKEKKKQCKIQKECRQKKKCKGW